MGVRYRRGGGHRGCDGLPKLAASIRKIKLRNVLQRADTVLENVETLSTQSISDAVKSGLESGLAAFAAEQKKRDTQNWKIHNDCHTEITAALQKIDKASAARDKNVRKIVKDVTYIKGHLNLGQD